MSDPAFLVSSSVALSFHIRSTDKVEVERLVKLFYDWMNKTLEDARRAAPQELEDLNIHPEDVLVETY